MSGQPHYLPFEQDLFFDEIPPEVFLSLNLMKTTRRGYQSAGVGEVIWWHGQGLVDVELAEMEAGRLWQGGGGCSVSNDKFLFQAFLAHLVVEVRTW